MLFRSDPLLRMGAPAILRAPIDAVIAPDDFSRVIQESAPDRFSPINLQAIGSRMSSSWLQSGHLSGGKVRKRSHPRLSPESTVYALLLGRLAGARGPRLFSTFWTTVLDAPMETIYDLTTEASRRGLVDFRRVGSVVDVGFSRLLTAGEEEALHESH